jgi:alkyldihydroxyacetonephosphate synthase
MNKTYRQILKWGDKREQTITPMMIKMLKEKFGLSDADFETKYLSGQQEVQLEKKTALKQEQFDFIKNVVGEENILTDDFSRANFSYGKFYAELLKLRLNEIPNPPDMVVSPKNNDHIIKIVAYCNNHKIPIIPVGGQSSVTGALQTPYGGIALDLTKHLNKVIKVNEINKSVTVQAGMYGPAFEKELNKKGYSCGHFPQSFEFSTVGGWLAAKGAGQASTGYGKIDDMVLSLKAVSPAGIIETKDFPKTAQGWDIFPLFIGSEGTLGIITEVTMKLRNYRPQNTSFASFIFKSFEDATTAMRTIIQSEYGLPHLFRISDPSESDIAFKTKGFDNTFQDKFLKMFGYLPGKRCLMFVSIEGQKEYTELVVKNIKKTSKKYGAMSIGQSPVKKWLEQRYSSAYMREPLMDAGIMTDTLETSVTWENMLKVWESAHKYVSLRPKTVLMIHISHVYENGANLYFTFLSPMKKGNEKDDFIQFHKGLVETIMENGGSLSHHHGVGRVLAPWMEKQLGKTSMQAMQAIKNHFDPNNIMNPGGTLGLK